MTRVAFTRATVFDSVRRESRPGGTVVVEGERIVDVAGRTLLPGLIDAHMHMTSTVPDFLKLALMPRDRRSVPEVIHGTNRGYGSSCPRVAQ